MEFMKKHWYILTLSSLAIAAAAVAVFFPYGYLADLAFGLASSAAFSALGAYAAPVAVATVAAGTAASVFAAGGILAGLVRAVSWLSNKLFGKVSAEPAVAVQGAPAEEPVHTSAAALSVLKQAPAPAQKAKKEKGSEAANDASHHSAKPAQSPAQLSAGLGIHKPKRSGVVAEGVAQEAAPAAAVGL